MVDYCLSFLNMEKADFSERISEEEFFSEPCTILSENGIFYVTAVSDILPELKNTADFFSDESLEKIYNLSEKYLKDRGFTPDKHISIIRCFDLTGVTGEKTDAVLLEGSEEDSLFSDLPYLVSKGPVFGILKNDKVISLAGAVIKDGVYNIHIETAPSERHKGYAKACLLALCNYLYKGNAKILYECRSENRASVKTVMGAGGTEACRYVRFIGRK